MQIEAWNNPKLCEVLSGGGIVVMPTDTIYGLLGPALSREAVDRIYEMRKRNPEKPNIILIGDMGELEKFDVALSEEQKNKLEEYWHSDKAEDLRPVSIILDCPSDRFAYLHRGTKTLAFRLPRQKELRDLLNRTGPLAAPSANPEGLPPAANIKEAQDYFGGSVDFYSDGGEIASAPSKIVRLNKDGSVSIIRE